MPRDFSRNLRNRNRFDFIGSIVTPRGRFCLQSWCIAVSMMISCQVGSFVRHAMCKFSGVYIWKEVIPKQLQHMHLNIQMYATPKVMEESSSKWLVKTIRNEGQKTIRRKKEKPLSKSWKQNLKRKSIQKPSKLMEMMSFSLCLSFGFISLMFFTTFCQSHSTSFVILGTCLFFRILHRVFRRLHSAESH